MEQVTWEDWCSHWLSSKLVKQTTYETYECLLRLHLLPVLHGRLLDTITPRDAQAVVTGAATPDLSIRLYQTMTDIFNLAVEQDYLDKTPMRGVKCRPKPEYRYTVLTPQQMRDIASQAGHYEGLIMFLAFTGVRFGEAIALRQQDWTQGEAVIHRNIVKVKGGVIETTPKSNKSRIVAVPSFLDKYRVDSDHVFTSKRGRVINHANFLKLCWYRLEKPMGTRVHDLRHSYATALINGGANVKAVQRQLGHANISTTLDIYGHLYDDYRREINNILTAA